jgi:P27 family predicted phage terminase small subunit
MAALGTLSSQWSDAIADYSSCVDEAQTMTAILEDLGSTYQTTTANGDTMFRKRPEVAIRSDAMKRAMSLRAELGLGPASKSKISSEKTPERNPFADL